MLASSRLDMGHARALLPLDPRQQIAIARQANKAGWSVRQVEKAVRGQLDPEKQGRGRKAQSVDMQTRWLQQQLGKELGHKVALRPARNGHYRLDIGFSDLEQLQALLGNIQTLVRQVSATAGPRAREQQG
ncbi:MAG: hypothetical protein U5K76_04880 [Woeseiaceae bacterium]|nr:hypothetical protein [Woeseiaceae bacterium]